MNKVFRTTCAFFLLSMLVFATTTDSWAARRKTTPTVVYLPITELQCNPCAEVTNAPSSTTNPTDVCCEYVVVGWQEVTTTTP